MQDRDQKTVAPTPETQAQTPAGPAGIAQFKQDVAKLPFPVQKQVLQPPLPMILTSSVSEVQAMDGGGGVEGVRTAAAEGVRGAGTALPHLDAIQRSFGHHDVSNVQAHVGGSASKASENMGAKAYATGNQVAFKETPDVHTAAHEAAHVVQQRAGVSLEGGLGKAGDAYEKHADSVADRVVQGGSAQGLLDGGTGGSGSAVQASVQGSSPQGSSGADSVFSTGGAYVQAATEGDKKEEDAYELYTVGQFETLSGIAKKLLGNPYRWKEIGQLNGISDRRGVTAGQQIKVPKDKSGKKDSGSISLGVGPDPAESLPEPQQNTDDKPEDTGDVNAQPTSEEGADLGEGKETPVPGSDLGPLDVPAPTPNPGMSETMLPPALVCDADFHLGTTPNMSMPNSPAILGSGGIDMDYMIKSATGKTPGQHVQVIQQGYLDLEKKSESAKQEFAKTASDLTVKTDTTGSAKLQEVGTNLDASSMSLVELMGTGISDLMSWAEQSVAEMKAREEAAVKAAQDSAKQSNAQMNEAFMTATQTLMNAKVEWQGHFSTTVTTQAQKISTLGAEYESAALVASEQAEADAKKAGETGSGEMAFDEADLKSRAKIYKNYAPAFKKYADQAANFLVETAAQGETLAENLLAPSIDSLYPAATAHTTRVATEAGNYNQKIQAETATYVAKTEEIKNRDQAFLEGQKNEAVATTDQAKQGIQTQVDASTTNVKQHTALATTRLTNQRDLAMNECNAIASVTPGLPSSPAITEVSTLLQGQIQQEAALGMSVLQEDENQAMSQITTEADQRMCSVDQSIEAYKGEVSTGIQTSKQAIGDANKDASDQVNAAGESTNNTVNTAGQATTLNTGESSVETQTGAADYEKTVLERLTNYTNSAIGQLLTLKTKMDTAAVESGKAARGAEKTELRRRYKEAYEAIDGIGTDESKLIKSLANISKAESSYIQSGYESFSGNSLRGDIIDDTSKGDNVRESCFAYLEGDVIAGAKYAMKYATDYTMSNAFGADTDLLNTTMSGLNEEQRTKLLNDPEFPALKKNIEFRLSQEKNDPIFGANKYDVDTFAVLADKNVSHKDAHLQVEVIKLTKAFEGTNNPFTWGTDEAAVWEIMGKLEGEDLAKFKTMFKKYHGTSLEAELDDELSGLEYKRGMALARGDKVTAQVYAVEYALQEGKEEEVFTLLDDPNLSNSADWLAQKEAQSNREQMITGWEDKFGNGTTLKQSLQDRLKSEGTNAGEIGVALLYGENAPVEYLLAYAIIRNGTNEAYAQKAIKQLKTELGAIADPAMKAARWKQICMWFKTNHGIDNLELYLGVGKYKYMPGGNFELDGQERHDFDIVLQEAMSDMDSVHDRYKIAQNNYEWYRGKGANVAGNAITDLFTSSGERLDHFWKKVNELYSDKTWFDARGKALPEKKAIWDQYVEYCEHLDLMAEVYKGKRDSITNAICTILVTIAAVVSTVLTAGALAPLWVGVAITAGAGLTSIIIKATMKGNAYGENEMLTDFAKVIVETVVNMATAGVGGQWFAKSAEFFKALAKGGFLARVGGVLLKNLPNELMGLLTNEKIWDDANAFWAAFGAMAFKMIATTVTGDLTDKYIKDAVGGKMGELAKLIVDQPLSVIFDPSIATQTKDEIAWGIIKGYLQGAATIGGTALAQNYLISSYNKQGTLTAEQVKRLEGVDPDARDAIFMGLNEQVQQSLPKNLWPKAVLDKLGAGDQTAGDQTTSGEPAPVTPEASQVTAENAKQYKRNKDGTWTRPDGTAASPAEVQQLWNHYTWDDNLQKWKRPNGDQASFAEAEYLSAQNGKPMPTRKSTAATGDGTTAPATGDAEPPKKTVLEVLNTGTQEELMALPGIGEEKAKKIIAARDPDKPYKSVYDVEKISGVGGATTAKLSEQHVSEALQKAKTSGEFDATVKALGITDVDKAYELVKQGKYDELVAMISVTVPDGKLVLWSGAGCKEMATSQGTELNTTNLGQLALALTKMTEGGMSWPQQKLIWDAVSAQFVKSASGEVNVFLGTGYGDRGGVRPEAVFGGVEQKALLDLQKNHPELGIQIVYHPVVKKPDGTFFEPFGSAGLTDASAVPAPESLFWKTGNMADIGKTNPDSKLYVPGYKKSDGTEVDPHLRSRP